MLLHLSVSILTGCRVVLHRNIPWKESQLLTTTICWTRPCLPLPLARWILLWTVCILLQCTLVFGICLHGKLLFASNVQASLLIFSGKRVRQIPKRYGNYFFLRTCFSFYICDLLLLFIVIVTYINVIFVTISRLKYLVTTLS